MDYLNTYWSNIKCPSNNGMSAWKSTWKTYGTCTGLDEYNYFYTALVLRHHIFDLLSILKNNGNFFFELTKKNFKSIFIIKLCWLLQNYKNYKVTLINSKSLILVSNITPLFSWLMNSYLNNKNKTILN